MLEGRLVGDEWQWTVHPPAVGMGLAQYIEFIDSRTWMLVSSFIPTGEGTWITRDAGASFQRLDDAEAASGWQLYRSPDGTMYRPPHVLWFDETYDEERFFLTTVRSIAQRASLLVVAGTSAQTNLPWQVVSLAERAGATIVDINPEDNPFGDIAERSGGVIRGPSASALAAIANVLR